MQQAQYFTKERGLPGDFTHYSFHQEEIAGLQCVDAVAWVCYQYALNAFFETPFQEFAEMPGEISVDTSDRKDGYRL